MTCNNTYLKTQLSYAMKINFEMAKKPNLDATQTPEYKKLVEKAKKKAAF